MGLAYIENLNGDVISYMDDPLNKTNYRNTNNTYNEDFNCGGWALNTFNWLCPLRYSCFNVWSCRLGR